MKNQMRKDKNKILDRSLKSLEINKMSQYLNRKENHHRNNLKNILNKLRDRINL